MPRSAFILTSDMGQVLYRKYRSRNFDEIVGQNHIVTILEQALKQGKVAHAYLFTGPRGVGKTSVARVLAHEVNKLDYDPTSDQQHLDIIEIDAASNRRIDEIRDLREKVHLAPTSAHYKIYIIDEVHMLTSEAFNALLKTLEEPPDHVIFILATTEAHKVPDTIISRTQRFHFRPIDPTGLAKHLEQIAQKEHIDIDNKALQTLALHASGSFRDGLSLLDQVSGHSSKISNKVVEQILGLAPLERVEALLQSVIDADVAMTFKSLTSFYEEGISPADIARSLSHAARDLYIENSDAPDIVIDLAEAMIEVEEAPDVRLKLETSLVRLIALRSKSTKTSAKQRSEAIETNDQDDTAAEEVVNSKPLAESMGIAEKAPTTVDSDGAQARDLIWNKFLLHLKSKNESLYALMRMGQHKFEPEKNTLTVTFKFAFHQKRAADAKNKLALSNELQNHLGFSPEIILTVDNAAVAKKEQELDSEPKAGGLSQAASILGGDVVEIDE